MTQVEVVVWFSLVIGVPHNVQAQRRLALQELCDFGQRRLRFRFDRILVGLEVEAVDRYLA